MDLQQQFRIFLRQQKRISAWDKQQEKQKSLITLKGTQKMLTHGADA